MIVIVLESNNRFQIFSIQRKKVKAKKPETDEIMKASSDSFQRIQRDMQRMNKGRPKGFRSAKDPPGRVLSFKKMKRKSMQRS